MLVAPSEPAADGGSPARGGSGIVPVLGELEHVAGLMRQALGPDGAVVDGPPAGATGLFVPDALTNPAYVRYALKGTLAVMICYVLQSAVDWPGIRTCIVTCLIVALGSEGATVEKGMLRISGAVVGAAMGFLTILFVVPRMESITSLVLVVAAGTAVAGWVLLGSPRVAYAGVQIAFAFYVCVIQGFGPTWYFYTIRDRLIGILLGNAVITLVFHWVWPVRAADAMWTSLASAIRAMARLAGVSDRAGVVPAAERARLQATHDFAAAQQLADQAAFEPGDPSDEGLAARERLQRAAADAQSVFLTELAIVRQPLDGGPPLPHALADAMRRFDAAVADSLDTIAARAAHGAVRPLPDLHVRLAAVTEQAAAGIASRDLVHDVDARVALYRDLTQRIERLSAGLAA